MRLRDKVIWITGASSGIGEALAVEMAGRGNVVLLSARREEELQRVAANIQSQGGQAHVLPMDLTDIEGMPKRFEEVLRMAGRVDVLVNNGGISQRSYARDTPLELDRDMFEINFFSSVALTKVVLPHMRERGSGQICAISSVVGFFGFKQRTAYSASKHAMKGFFESLRLEEWDSGIEVNVVYPGSIRTNISKYAVNEKGEAHGQMDPRQQGGMPADLCARKIIRGMERNKGEILVGRRELLLVYVRRCWPWLYFRAAKNIDPT